VKVDFTSWDIVTAGAAESRHGSCGGRIGRAAQELQDVWALAGAKLITRAPLRLLA